jgi:hypothetical protein
MSVDIAEYNISRCRDRSSEWWTYYYYYYYYNYHPFPLLGLMTFFIVLSDQYASLNYFQHMKLMHV